MWNSCRHAEGSVCVISPGGKKCVAVSVTIEYHSNETYTAFQYSNRLRRWKRGIRGERERIRKWTKLGFLQEHGQFKTGPGIMSDLCVSSTRCSLWLYKNTQGRSRLRVKHSKTFHSRLCLYWGGGALAPLKSSLQLAYMQHVFDTWLQIP